MQSGYAEDLAYIHDTAFGQYARAAAPVVLDALRQRGLAHGLVVELGCGSGILSGELAASGYDVLGIDQSAAMIELAERRVPSGRFQLRSLYEAELPPCSGVVAIGECFNYLFDSDDGSRQPFRELFRRIDAALLDRGVLVFDIAEPGRAGNAGASRRYFEGPDWAVLVATDEDPQRGILTRDMTTFRQVGELYRRGQEVHRLRLIPREEVTAELAALGFEVQILTAYGDLQLPPGLVGIVAGKS